MAVSKRPSEEVFQAYLLGNKQAYRTIKNGMVELVRRIARVYKEYAPMKELVPIGMTYFDFALQKYAQHRAKAGKAKPYKFSTYFTWWARESIEAYLGLKKNGHLERITSRLDQDK